MEDGGCRFVSIVKAYPVFCEHEYSYPYKR